MQALDDLNTKLNLLLKKHAVLQAENKRLRETVSRLEDKEKQLTEKVAGLEHNMVSINLDGSSNDPASRNNMREQLDLVINEIDRILTTLND